MLVFRADPQAHLLIFGHVADLDAQDRAQDDAHAKVMLGSLCGLTAAGDIALPADFRTRVGLGRGSRIMLHVQDMTTPIAMEPIEARSPALARLALRQPATSTPARRLDGLRRTPSRHVRKPKKTALDEPFYRST